MAFYCPTMLSMALELAYRDVRVYPAYEDMASKFLEHFVQIADAINCLGGTGLWDEEDGFYYDQIQFDHSSVRCKIKVRSLVGLLPLITAEVYEDTHLERLPGFYKRLVWFRRLREDSGDVFDAAALRIRCAPDHTIKHRKLTRPKTRRYDGSHAGIFPG